VHYRGPAAKWLSKIWYAKHAYIIYLCTVLGFVVTYSIVYWYNSAQFMCFYVIASTFSRAEKSLQQVAAMVARSHLWFHCNSVTYVFIETFCLVVQCVLECQSKCVLLCVRLIYKVDVKLQHSAQYLPLLLLGCICWFVGRKILTELSLCYSIVYRYNSAQCYKQFLPLVDWIGLGLAWFSSPSSEHLCIFALYGAIYI